jgi:DNA-binding beta-propeller fold protein YncE
VDLAYDGATIWVANYGSGTVSKLRAADGTPWGTVSLPGGPVRLAFDGVNVWAAVESEDMVVKL